MKTPFVGQMVKVKIENEIIKARVVCRERYINIGITGVYLEMPEGVNLFSIEEFEGNNENYNGD